MEEDSGSDIEFTLSIFGGSGNEPQPIEKEPDVSNHSQSDEELSLSLGSTFIKSETPKLRLITEQNENTHPKTSSVPIPSSELHGMEICTDSLLVVAYESFTHFITNCFLLASFQFA
jgi:hypothetical protein